MKRASLRVAQLFAAAASAIAVACSPADTPASEPSAAQSADAGVVNVYSARHYEADLDLYEAFTQETGVKVNLIEADADALITRIASEGEFSPADVLLTVDAGRLWRAEEAGVLAPVESEVLNDRIPAAFRQPDNLWFGYASRARVIIYNKEMGLERPIETYEDLADPAYAGQICMRSSSNIYNVSLLASLVSHDGPEAAENWAKGVVANFARSPQGNDTSNIESVAAGVCRISIANSYYIARFIASDDPAQHAIADQVEIIFPNQSGRGAHVNISGGGVARHAPNRENAVRFLEFLTSETAQTILAEGNHEYPVIASAGDDSAIRQLGTFVADELEVANLGRNQTEAVRILDRVGWN